MFPSFVNEMFEYEMKSVLENQEKSLLICNNKVHEIPSTWKNGMLQTSITMNDIQSKCGTENPLIAHTHIMHTSDPSEQDFNGYDHTVFDGMCVAGIDGLKCFNNDREKIYSQHWVNKFQTEFAKKIGKTWEGKNMYCDSIGDHYYCELQSDSMIEKMGIFDKLTINNGKVTVNSNNANIAVESRNKIVCFGMKDGTELSCLSYDES
jgi:hypothetical protein